MSVEQQCRKKQRLTVGGLKELCREIHCNSKPRFKSFGRSYQYKVKGILRDRLCDLFSYHRMDDEDVIDFLEYMKDYIENKRSTTPQEQPLINKMITERLGSLPLEDRNQFIR